MFSFSAGMPRVRCVFYMCVCKPDDILLFIINGQIIIGLFGVGSLVDCSDWPRADCADCAVDFSPGEVGSAI